jgi:thioredoxin-dependent peroxiredoxin
MLKTGDKVPANIKILDEKNQPISLKKFLGKPFVIYFYPKDNTRGCTRQAKDFDQFLPEFNKLGWKIIGVSKDSVESHLDFKKKFELGFELLSDPEKKLHEAFGVWQEKRMFYKTYMGTIRSTFVVDEKGKIIKDWLRVNPKGHAQKVLRVLQERSEGENK